MRRLSTILMIAALLAALVPSATLAGKPVPVITAIGSTGWDMGLPGLCTVYVNVTWEGRGVSAVNFTELSGGSSPTEWEIARTDRAAMTTFQQVALAASTISFRVQLLDRKGNPFGEPQTTSGDTWTNSASCPNGPTGAAYAP